MAELKTKNAAEGIYYITEKGTNGEPILVGSGKTAKVFLARSSAGSDKKRYAMKVFGDDHDYGEFRAGLIEGPNSVKGRFGSFKENLVTPIEVLELTSGGFCAILPYIDGRDLGLLLDIVNDIKGTMDKDTTRYKKHGDMPQPSPLFTQDHRWQALAYTISLQLLKGIETIHTANRGRPLSHGDLTPSNVLIDIGGPIENLSLEEILSMDPTIIKVKLNDMAFEGIPQESRYTGGTGAGALRPFRELYDEQEDKRRNPLRRFERYTMSSCSRKVDYNQARDIYAAGRMIIELLTGLLPSSFEEERLENGLNELELLKRLRTGKDRVNLDEELIFKIITQMLSPQTSVTTTLQALTAELRKNKKYAVPEIDQKTTSSYFPVMMRPVHDFMHKYEAWNKQLVDANSKMPKPGEVYGLTMALWLAREMQEVRKTVPTLPDMKSCIDGLEPAERTNQWLNRPSAVEFDVEKVTQEYIMTINNEPFEADKKRITDQYTLLMKKYAEVHTEFRKHGDARKEALDKITNGSTEIARVTQEQSVGIMSNSARTTELIEYAKSQIKTQPPSK
jgi:serine/threonine protein kinase